jgi:putative ABC transport system permease protein
MKLFNLWRRKALDARVEEEFEGHLAMMEDDLVRGGMSREEARAEARRQFGSPLGHREAARDVRGLPWLEEAWQDARFGLRQMRKAPVFTAIAILTMGLGIGANTAIFALVNAALLRMAPYPEAERLVEVTKTWKGRIGYPVFDSRQFLYLRDNLKGFATVAARRDTGRVALIEGNGAREIKVTKVSAEYFHALGIGPQAGRELSAEEDLPNAAKAAVVSARLWRELDGGAFATGKTLNLGGDVVPVVGVLGAQFPVKDVDVFLPAQAAPVGDGDNTVVFARLDDGVSEEQFNEKATAVFRALLAESYPKYPKDLAILTQPFGNIGRGELRLPLYVLSAAVGLILLIACANLANLLLARASARQREMSIRASLGAGRPRLARQLMTESLLLAAGGALAGLALAQGAIPLLLALSPVESFATDWNVGIDGRVLAATALLAVLTGLLFGLAPAVLAGKMAIAGRQVGGGAVLQRALVAGEVALSFALLVLAGMLGQSLTNLMRSPSGVDESRVIAGKMSLRGERYDTAGESTALFERGMERIAGVPGVESVAVTMAMPLERGLNYSVTVPDAVDRPEEGKFANWRYVSANYFRVMGMRLVRGREFHAQEGARVAVVSEEFERKYFGARGALGRTLVEKAGDPVTRMIVGVVADVKANNLRKESPPTVYVPVGQAQDTLVGAAHTWLPMTWVIRTRGAGENVIGEVEKAMRGVDPLVPFQGFQTMADLRGELARMDRFVAWLMTAFAGLAMALAAAGIYGVVSYLVTRRIPEMGVRLALGAPARELALGVIGQGLRWTAAGIVAGAGLAYGGAVWMRSFLYGVPTLDWRTYLACGLLLAGVAVLAGLGPARRVLGVDPMRALRME